MEGGLVALPLLTCPWGLCSHAVLAFSMTATAMTVSPLGNGLSSCLHSSCMTEAFRSPGPAAAASTSPGSSSKSFPGPGGQAPSLRPLSHGGDAVPGSGVCGAPGRCGASRVLWTSAPVLWCWALEDGQELVGTQLGEVSGAIQGREVSPLQTGRAITVCSQEDAGSQGWQRVILEVGWPASQPSEARQNRSKNRRLFLPSVSYFVELFCIPT